MLFAKSGWILSRSSEKVKWKQSFTLDPKVINKVIERTYL